MNPAANAIARVACHGRDKGLIIRIFLD